MSDYSREEAAERAGVTVQELTRLIVEQVLPPRDVDRYTAADIRKAGLIRSMVAAGLPWDGLIAEINGGRITLDFLENPAFERFPALTDTTFADLSVSTGIPVETLMVIRESIGAAVPQPTDRVRENELAVVPLIEAQLAIGYPLSAIERGLRTVGDAFRRITKAEADAFNRYVIEPVALRPGATGADVSAAAAAATERLSEASDQALLAAFHGHEAQAWSANIFEGWERGLSQAGLYDVVDHPPAVCFLDITGYTRLTDERGDEAAADVAHQLSRLVERTSVQHGGRPVKWLGDGVMCYFPNPGPGVIAALDMADGVTDAGLPPAHVGIHAGPVVVQEGDYYGQTVNIASRIAEYARPGEVVVSQAVVEASANSGAAFTAIGPVELKGVTGPVQLHVARRS